MQEYNYRSKTKEEREADENKQKAEESNSKDTKQNEEKLQQAPEAQSSQEAKDKEKKDSEKPNLFGEAPKKTGLFGDLSAAVKPGLFSNTSLFSNAGSSLFKNSSLFSDSNITKGASLFSNLNNTSTFLKKDEEDSAEDEDKLFNRTDDPEAFKPKEKVEPEESDYLREYLKQLDNIFIYSSENKKFVSKGNGYLSLELHKTKKYAIFLFRNSMGTKIIEGSIHEKLKDIEKYTKNFKHVASIKYLSLGSKPEVKYCKIPVSLILLI